jgi:hypothetical protein
VNPHRKGDPVVNRIRIAALAAVPALTLAGALTLAPSASADVGDVLVQQMNASGQEVCTQDYVAANLTEETISDQACVDAATAAITNDTLEPITVSITSDPQTIQPGGSYEINIILLSATFNIELPGGV